MLFCARMSSVCGQSLEWARTARGLLVTNIQLSKRDSPSRIAFAGRLRFTCSTAEPLLPLWATLAVETARRYLERDSGFLGLRNLLYVLRRLFTSECTGMGRSWLGRNDGVAEQHTTTLGWYSDSRCLHFAAFSSIIFAAFQLYTIRSSRTVEDDTVGYTVLVYPAAANFV